LQFLDTLEERWRQLLKAVENYPRLFVRTLGATTPSPISTCTS
jgi:hypothetical protein